jgi:type I restriction enzyme S subunit
MQEPITFSDLIAETKDGEWGEGQEAPGYVLCEVIRGTDFANLHAPNIELPQRWIPEHLVTRKALRADDILIETAGGTAKQPTGRTALITKDFLASRAGRPVMCSSFARHLRVDRDKVHPVYLYYVLQALYASGYMGVFNLQHTGVARFQFTAFRTKTRLTLHEQVSQPKIAATLKSYDDLIANNQRRIALLESMAEEIYREWFVRMRFPGAKSVVFDRGVPTDWTHEPILEAFKFYGGATPSKDNPRFWVDGEVHWYTPTDITGASSPYLEESADKCTDEGLQNCSANLCPAYSIMMTSRATIGAIGINCTPACTNQGFITCIPNQRYPLTYLYHWLKLAKPYFEMLSGGATFAELTKGTFKRIRILTPPEKLVAAYEKHARPMFDQIESLTKANRRLSASRDALLPRLISGKLRVDALDIQFPPSILPPSEEAAQPAALAT